MTSARSAAPASAVDEAGPDLSAIRELPFERALEQLEAIVRSLEKGDVPLDESVAIYERGEALKRHCDALLQRAEARIQKITLGADGRAAGTAPLDVDER
jgi:exodeoxyribonuclease VII small subunit